MGDGPLYRTDSDEPLEGELPDPPGTGPTPRYAARHEALQMARMTTLRAVAGRVLGLRDEVVYALVVLGVVAATLFMANLYLWLHGAGLLGMDDKQWWLFAHAFYSNVLLVTFLLTLHMWRRSL